MPAHHFTDRIELVGAPCAPQRRCDALIEHPPHGKVEHAARISLLSELIELLHGVEILPKARLLEFRVVQAEIIAGELRIGPHAARQKPSAQRAIAESRDAVLLAIRKHVALDRTLEQIIGWLHDVDGCNLSEYIHLR